MQILISAPFKSRFQVICKFCKLLILYLTESTVPKRVSKRSLNFADRVHSKEIQLLKVLAFSIKTGSVKLINNFFHMSKKPCGRHARFDFCCFYGSLNFQLLVVMQHHILPLTITRCEECPYSVDILPHSDSICNMDRHIFRQNARK